MMNKPGLIVLVIGLGLSVASLVADGIGIGRGPGFGNIQITGIVLGAVITAVGLLATFIMKKEED
jgi:hypothetical protein